METIFRIILPTLIIAFALHRGYYVKSPSQPQDVILKERQQGLSSKIGRLLGVIGFVAVIVFVIDPNWLAFAQLSLPLWSRWAGVALALTGFALLDLLTARAAVPCSKSRAQVVLGKSWSDTPRMMKGQTLIISGPYQFIRHPIYTAFILILGSTLLISSNWLIGLAWLGMTILEVISRIGFEESLMLEYFGDQYRDYIKTTGQLTPRLIR